MIKQLILEYGPDSEEDTRKLQEFCKEHGIYGFNKGDLSSKEALQYLKKKYKKTITDGVKTNKSILFG